MEGTVTISTEEYKKLLAAESAISKRRVFSILFQNGLRHFCATSKHHFVKQATDEIELLKKHLNEANERVCKARAELTEYKLYIENTRKKGWFR